MERKSLHDASMEAFRAAALAREKVVRPGSQEWDLWLDLVKAAIQANERFVNYVHAHPAKNGRTSEW